MYMLPLDLCDRYSVPINNLFLITSYMQIMAMSSVDVIKLDLVASGALVDSLIAKCDTKAKYQTVTH